MYTKSTRDHATTGNGCSSLCAVDAYRILIPLRSECENRVFWLLLFATLFDSQASCAQCNIIIPSKNSDGIRSQNTAQFCHNICIQQQERLRKLLANCCVLILTNSRLNQLSISSRQTPHHPSYVIVVALVVVDVAAAMGNMFIAVVQPPASR